MSKKHRPVKNPEKLLTSRQDVINFLNYISTDENFCLRVWNTVQSSSEIVEHEHEVALLP